MSMFERLKKQNAIYRKLTWRDQVRPIIKEVIKQYGLNSKNLNKALRDAYPFGQRKNYPYKVWLDEIKKQTGTQKKSSDKKTSDKQMKLFKQPF